MLSEFYISLDNSVFTDIKIQEIVESNNLDKAPKEILLEKGWVIINKEEGKPLWIIDYCCELIDLKMKVKEWLILHIELLQSNFDFILNSKEESIKLTNEQMKPFLFESSF